MSALLVLIAAGLLALSGVPGLFMSRRSMTGQRIATILATLGAGMGIAFAISGAAEPIERTIREGLIEDAFTLRIDGLSVIFLLPIFLMAGLGSIFGEGYWRQTNHPENGRKLRLFYGLLPASMVCVVIAGDGVSFLFAWEAMALSAFFLVTTEDEDAHVRRAGWIYLVAAHVGMLALVALFATLRYATGSFALEAIDPNQLGSGESGVTAAATFMFILGLVGFGLKAGVMPLHVWLPPAHASAPSHVSAMLSGVVIKMGIYGLVRLSSLLPPAPLSWGVTLLVLGAISAVVGVAYALAQHDLKRMLAYHSIENIGIIVIGLGLAMIGRSMERPEWIVLGLAGALLHVWNHAIFKTLLFLGAGSVIHAARARDIDRIGGLARAMPVTATAFTIGAVGICGLPPLNGFVSELLVYLGLFRTLGDGGGASMTGVALAAPALAAAGALALACFVKVIGMVFLGRSRRESGSIVRESPVSMLAPMIVLAACCVALGLAPTLAAPLLDSAIDVWAGSSLRPLPALASLAPFGWISRAGAVLILLAIAILCGVLALAMRRRIAAAPTWDCGFAGATPRIQYTGSSFAQMLVGLLGFVLRPRIHASRPTGLLPDRASFMSHVDDVVLEGWILPAFRSIEAWCLRARVLQQGRVQLYVAYVLGMLVLMLLLTFPIHDLIVRLLSR